MGSGGLFIRLAAVAGIAVAMIGVRPEQQARDPQPPVTYPIAADAENERTNASANFSVTWIHQRGPDAPNLRDADTTGVPDSVEGLLSAFETARAFLLGTMGYRPPPTSGLTRIYVASVEDSGFTKLAPAGQGASRASFFVIGTNQLRPPIPRQLRVLAVHEYFHAIQNGYDSDYDHWIGEATASWMEDVFDDAGDPNHDTLKEFVRSPRTSLTDITGEHEYGAFLFVQFLVERFGNGNPALVRELWEHMASSEATSNEAITSIEAILARRGVTLARAWSEFQLWRWDLDRFEEGSSYADVVGKEWPKPLQSTEVAEESCRLSSDQGEGLPPLSGDYSVFRPSDKPARAMATATVEGPPGAVAFALVQKDGGKENVQFLEIGQDGLASARVSFGDDQVKRVVLGVGNPAPTGPSARFGYSLRIDGRTSVEALPLSPPADTNYFGGLTLQGRVLCNGQPAPSADVILVQEKRSGEQRTFPLIAPAGTWSLTFEPDQTSTYHVEVVDPLLSPATSSSWDVGVRVALSFDVANPDVTLGQPVSVEGKITPAHGGALVALDYRRPELEWRSGPQISSAPDGTYETSLTLPSTGIWQLRATVLSTGDGDHVGTQTIHDVFVNVR